MMETRTLGRSGVEVTTLALGTMMFGAWGNTDAAAAEGAGFHHASPACCLKTRLSQ